jgi:glucose-1-phosphate adenylyltransferase
VTNSIVADGCIIEGKVEDSVLFRGVTIKKGVSVKNCIIMQGTVLEEDVNIENTILDKGVVLSKGIHLKGTSNFPIIVAKNMTV